MELYLNSPCLPSWPGHGHLYLYLCLSLSRISVTLSSFFICAVGSIFFLQHVFPAVCPSREPNPVSLHHNGVDRLIKRNYRPFNILRVTEALREEFHDFGLLCCVSCDSRRQHWQVSINQRRNMRWRLACMGMSVRPSVLVSVWAPVTQRKHCDSDVMLRAEQSLARF